MYLHERSVDKVDKGKALVLKNIYKVYIYIQYTYTVVPLKRFVL